MPALGQNRRVIRRNNGGTTAPGKFGYQPPPTSTGGTQAPPKPSKNPKPEPKKPPWAQGNAPYEGKNNPLNRFLPKGGGMPWDTQYNIDVAGAHKKLGNTLAYLQSKELTTKQNFGLDPQFADAATNPTSRAALLKQSYMQHQKANYNSAGNQLYAGSYVNKRHGTEGEYNRGYDELNRDYLAALGEINRERTQAEEGETNEIGEAGWRRVEAAQNQPLEPVPASRKEISNNARRYSGKAQQLRKEGKPRAARKWAQKAKRASERAKKA